jgi:hypothetical protein
VNVGKLLRKLLSRVDIPVVSTALLPNWQRFYNMRVMQSARSYSLEIRQKMASSKQCGPWMN